MKGAKAYQDLAPEWPIAWMPIRLETRFFEHDGENILGVRIFPDTLHADDHHRGVTEREADAGRRYWEWIWGHGISGKVDDEGERVISEARSWLATQVGAHRAPYVADQLRPLNAAQQTDGPKWPPVKPSDPPPITARLLPDEWMVRLYDENGALAFEEYYKGPQGEVVVAPSLAAGHDTNIDDPRGATRGFLEDQGLKWTFDFQTAVDAGMAIRIAAKAVPAKVSALLVTGVRADRAAIDEAGALFDVLSAHRFSRGLDLVPQGTPTNNTDAGQSGFSLDNPDIDAIFAVSERPGPGPKRALLEYLVKAPAAMYVANNADAASLALGHVAPNAFDWAASAFVADGSASWAMNFAIGYSSVGGFLAGPLLATPGKPTIPMLTIGELQAWYATWVRGGAALPTIRCGEQPYGLLPITSRPRTVKSLDNIGFRAGLEHYLAELLDLWRAALPVAALDPDASDARPATSADDAVSDVAAVLGAVPHPTALQLRDATDMGPSDRASLHSLIDAIQGYLADFTAGTGSAVQNSVASQACMDAWNPRKAIIDPRLAGNEPSIDQQLDEANALLVELQDLRGAWANFAGPIGNALAQLEQDLLPLLSETWLATEGLPKVLAVLHARGGVGAHDRLRLASTVFSEQALGLTHLVTGRNDALPLGDIVMWFERAESELRQLLADNALHKRTAHADEGPLLVHLLDVAYRFAPPEQLPILSVALLILKRIANQWSEVTRPDTDPDAEIVGDGPVGITTNPFGGSVRPVSEVTERLERLLRESLGLAMYRLDAWVLSLANERFATVRKEHPYGTHIGAYGWLVDLERSTEQVSQGYIHAPSLNHAATAAVLRSGWAAYGTSDAEAPLSVDLSSARVRRAQWILDGLRNGQDLAEVLGARFERVLHDNRLDPYIATVRQLALDVDGVAGPASAVVDGLLVARAAAGADSDRTEREEAMAGALADRLRGATGEVADEWRNVQRAAQAVGADLDSVADVVLFQSIHSLLQGDLATAGAATAISSGADASIPPITGTASQRDGQRIAHRVTAIVDNEAKRSKGLLGAAAPGLVSWLETLLVPASQATFGWQRDGSHTIARHDLGDLDIDVVSAMQLAGDGATQATSDLGRVVAARATATFGPGTIVTDGPVIDPNEVNVDEFGLIASRLLDALGQSRGLRADDLVLATVDATGDLYAVGRIEARTNAVLGELQSMRDAIRTGVGRANALISAAAHGVAGAVTAIEAIDTDHGPDFDTVVAALEARIGDGPLAVADPERRGPRTEADALTATLRSLLGGRLPIPVGFLPATPLAPHLGDADLTATVVADGPTWLRQAGRVRRAVGALDEALLLAGAVRGEHGPFGVIQFPVNSRPWVANGKPSTSGDQLSIVSVTGFDRLDGSIAGILVDAWAESIPRTDQVTGIAVHFDAPSARPPQTILLSTVEKGSVYSADGIADQLLFTLELAKIRAIGPVDLGVGQVFPSVYLDPDLDTADDAAAREQP